MNDDKTKSPALLRAVESEQKRADSLGKSLEAAMQRLTDAERSLAKASADYESALPLGRDAALGARRLKEEAEVDRDIARHAVTAIEGQITTSRDAVRQARIAHLTAKAQEMAAAFEEMAARELTVMTVAARALLRASALAALARTEAISSGADEALLPEVEAFRRIGSRPRQDIEVTRVTRWLHPRTLNPLDDDQSRRVSVGEDGRAFLASSEGGSQGSMPLHTSAEFDRIVYREYMRGRPVLSLVNALTIPGLRGDDTPGWEASEELSPWAVLKRLEALEAAPPPDRQDRRPSQIELRPVPASIAAQ